MGIALHPYLVGQPYRLRHLRRALAHIAARRAWRGLDDHAGRDLRRHGRPPAAGNRHLGFALTSWPLFP
jgi:hypothetical protein